MPEILVVESDRHTLHDLLAILPEGGEGVADTAEAAELLEENAAAGLYYDMIIVQGAARDGRVGTGQVSITLDFLRKVHREFAQPELKIVVLSGMFDHSPTVKQYQAAFPGCQVLNKTSVLNRTTPLSI